MSEKIQKPRWGTAMQSPAVKAEFPVSLQEVRARYLPVWRRLKDKPLADWESDGLRYRKKFRWRVMPEIISVPAWVIVRPLAGPWHYIRINPPLNVATEVNTYQNHYQVQDTEAGRVLIHLNRGYYANLHGYELLCVTQTEAAAKEIIKRFLQAAQTMSRRDVSAWFAARQREIWAEQEKHVTVRRPLQ